MKAARGEIERAVARPGGFRLYLLYGPDDSASRALAEQLARAMGDDAERIDLSPATLKADPARLADEAAAMSLFGGPRHIRIDGAGDESLEAIEALLEAPAAGNPVAVIAGVLRKESKLLKRALAAPAILAHASYPPEGAEADRLVIAAARPLGLSLRGDVARRIAEAAGGDRAIIAQELEKLALFLDAAPERPAEIEHAQLDALGADTGEGDLDALVNAVVSGVPEQVQGELARLAIDGIPLIRAVLVRLHLLAEYRAQVEAGNSATSVLESRGKGLFWKTKLAIAPQLARWTSAALATAIDRLGAAYRQAMNGAGAGLIGVEAELIAIARAAQRMR